MMTSNSPYLSPNRLADVIAAFQAMSTYKFYKLTFTGWADRISADTEQGERWKRIFKEHPEFFRLDSAPEKASLVWRRQFPRQFHVDLGRALTDQEYQALPPADYVRISRNPLQPSDIKTLIDTAVNLHSRALEHKKDQRWWIPLVVAVVSALGALLGSLLGAYLKSRGLI
jgi:ribosomal protein S15P/S13E